jgi:mannose-1-phosphate guanylyltransferase
MKAVILAGGPGTRLWPVSNPQSSKAFQPVIRGESMLQYTYRQLRKVFRPQDLYIQAPRGLEAAIVEQLPGLDAQHIVLNPIPKDTLPITLWVMNELGSDPTEPILFRSVDQFIEDDQEGAFLSSLSDCIQRYDYKTPRITLLCTKYRSFHPGNGYVVADNAKNIITFVEKPTEEVVGELPKQGTLYRNPFMIIASKKAFLDVLEDLDYPWSRMGRQLLSATRQDREQLFLDMELLSIDYTIFETSHQLKMDEIDYDFLDVGTYRALYELNEKDISGNVVIGQVIVGKNCRNNFICNQNTQPLVVDSINDSVVAQTPAGSLVISMENADRIKEIHKKQLQPK